MDPRLKSLNEYVRQELPSLYKDLKTEIGSEAIVSEIFKEMILIEGSSMSLYELKPLMEKRVESLHKVYVNPDFLNISKISDNKELLQRFRERMQMLFEDTVEFVESQEPIPAAVPQQIQAPVFQQIQQQPSQKPAASSQPASSSSSAIDLPPELWAPIKEGELTWAYITHLGSYNDFQFFSALAHGELGITDKSDGPTILWSLVQNGIISTFKELTDLFTFYDKGGLLQMFDIKNKKFKDPIENRTPTPLRGPTLEQVFNACGVEGLTFEQVLRIFSRVIEGECAKIAKPYLNGNATCRLAMRVLLENGVIKNLDSFTQMLESIGKPGLVALLPKVNQPVAKAQIKEANFNLTWAHISHVGSHPDYQFYKELARAELGISDKSDGPTILWSLVQNGVIATFEDLKIMYSKYGKIALLSRYGSEIKEAVKNRPNPAQPLMGPTLEQVFNHCGVEGMTFEQIIRVFNVFDTGDYKTIAALYLSGVEGASRRIVLRKLLEMGKIKNLNSFVKMANEGLRNYSLGSSILKAAGYVS